MIVDLHQICALRSYMYSSCCVPQERTVVPKEAQDLDDNEETRGSDFVSEI